MMVGAQSLVVLQLPDFGGRHEAAAQQSVRVQRGQPLAVGHVGLAARNILHVPAVDHHHRQPSGFQHLVEVEPVNAGGLQRHGLHALFREPVAQGLQITGEGAEDFRRVARDGDVAFFTADINRGSLGIEHRQSFHDWMGCRLFQRVSRQVPDRLLKDEPPQREPRTSGVTKQCACRRPEPISPAGSPGIQNAPKDNAATLRPPTDAAKSIRFRGSKREIPFGRILSLHHARITLVG